MTRTAPNEACAVSVETCVPRRGSSETSPSRASSLIASRIGPRLVPKRSARSVSISFAPGSSSPERIASRMRSATLSQRADGGVSSGAEPVASLGVFELLENTLRHPIEEGPPPLLGAFVLLGSHAPALLEVHLGPAVAEVLQHHDHELIPLLARLVGDREHEPLRLDHLEVLALPPALTTVGAGEHRGPEGASLAHVHGDRRHGHLRLRPAEPIREPLALRPFPPDTLTRCVEYASHRDPRLGRGAGVLSLSHRSRSLLGAPRAGRSCPPKTDDTSRASRRPLRAAPLGAVTAGAEPSGFW